MAGPLGILIIEPTFEIVGWVPQKNFKKAPKILEYRSFINWTIRLENFPLVTIFQCKSRLFLAQARSKPT